MELPPAVLAEIDSALTGPITVDITTTGRTSGLARRIEIWIVNIDGRVMIGGTPRARDWLANLRSDPSLIVHFKETTTVDVAAVATEVDDPAVRQATWEYPSTEWYRRQTPVRELVADAPLVELHWVLSAINE